MSDFGSFNRMDLPPDFLKQMRDLGIKYGKMERGAVRTLRKSIRHAEAVLFAQHSEMRTRYIEEGKVIANTFGIEWQDPPPLIDREEKKRQFPY